MNQNSGRHFDRQAVIRWQMGDATEAEREHLANCDACQAEASPLNDALEWFGAWARQWGEGKAALSAHSARVRHVAMVSWRVLVGVCAAATVALLLMFGIGLPHWRNGQAANQAKAQQRQIEQQRQEQREIASDNALLEEVDQDVSREVPAAMQPLSWNATTTASSSAERQ